MNYFDLASWHSGILAFWHSAQAASREAWRRARLDGIQDDTDFLVSNMPAGTEAHGT